MRYRPILSLKPKLGFFRTRVSCFTLVAALALSSFGSAAQRSGKVWWPQFRGPNSSGLGEGRPPVHFGPDQNVLWKTAVGAGLSSPIVWEDCVFLTEVDQPNKHLSTLCIDRRTGKILWRCTVAPEQIEKVHDLSSPAGATPATDGESVYVYFGSYGLVSVRPERECEMGKTASFAGKPLWRGFFTNRRGRTGGAQPSRERRLPARRQSP